MTYIMECNTGPESDCENCVLCSASSRAHSWKKSGQAFIEVVRQKGKTGLTYVCLEISEKSKRFEEAHPKTTEFLGKTGRKIRFAGVKVVESSKKLYHRGVSVTKDTYTKTKSAAVPLAQGVKRFFIKNTIRCYFAGGVMLISGTLLYLVPAAAAGSSSLFLGSVVLFSIGSVSIWLPIIYWWHSNENILECSSQQLVDKPPSYESLPPAFSFQPPVGLEHDAPPTYEESFTESHGLLNYSDCEYVGGSPCAVHRVLPAPFSTDNPQSLTTIVEPSVSHSVHEPNPTLGLATVVQCPEISQRKVKILQRSKSMTDFCGLRLEFSCV